MAIVIRSDEISGTQSRLRRYSDSAVNALLTVNTQQGGAAFRLDKVTVHYSAPVTLDVTVTLDSGAGAAWDALLLTIALAVAQNGVWIPDEELIFSGDDALIVVAPDGGAGVTGAVAIYLEEVGR